MRPLQNSILVMTLAAAASLWADRTASGDELQWVHNSRQKSPSAASATRAKTAPVVKQQPASRPAPTRPATAKQPTFRQPQQFKQPTSAKPVASHQPASQAASVAARPASASNDGYRNRRANQTPGVTRMAQHVAPAQWDGPTYEGPIYEGEEYLPGEAVYAGEVGCGCPEPSCGYAGPCGCGDGCYLDEPGCGIPYGGDVVMGDPGCGVVGPGECCGDCVDGCCECGDACCGGVIGEPTCGCGGVGCDDCRNWPQALFGCDDRGCVPILWVPPIKEVTFFGGVHGFKNPLDGTRDGGNFGFHEGFNIGGKMAWLPWPGLGYQFGWQATHNQLSGDANTGTDDSHSQHFLTTGLFRRSRLGLQFGVVWDMLRDERQGSNDYGQVRGEISFKNYSNRELGFAFMANSNDNVVNMTRYQAADQYLFFYRLLGRQGGECRAFAGFTGQSNAVIGSDFQTPLTNRWSLQGNWAYLIPDSGNEGSAARDEAWNLSMQLVWHYGCRAKSWQSRPYRPMFNVADNGSLIVVD